MVTGIDLFRRYGHPDVVKKTLTLWKVPDELRKGKIPAKIYCHPTMVGPLSAAFKNLIDRGFIDELKTWDGCHNIRPIRGREEDYETAMKEGKLELAMKYLSIHSWGIAIDVNAKENGLGKKPALSIGFVKCFIDAGFEWGGTWARLDGMHFQLAKILS